MHIYREVVLDLVGLGYDVVYNTFHTYSVTFDFAFFFFDNGFGHFYVPYTLVYMRLVE